MNEIVTFFSPLLIRIRVEILPEGERSIRTVKLHAPLHDTHEPRRHLDLAEYQHTHLRDDYRQFVEISVAQREDRPTQGERARQPTERRQRANSHERKISLYRELGSHDLLDWHGGVHPIDLQLSKDGRREG